MTLDEWIDFDKETIKFSNSVKFHINEICALSNLDSEDLEDLHRLIMISLRDQVEGK